MGVSDFKVLFQLFETNEKYTYCICSKNGAIESLSDRMKSFFNTSPGVIFEINPELSFLDWKKIWELADSGKLVKQESKVLIHGDKVESCNIKIWKIDPRKELCIYLIEEFSSLKDVSPNNGNQNAQNLEKIPQGEAATFNYDEISRNLILYFDDQGKILRKNPALSKIVKEDINNINKLFLETDLGPLTGMLDDFKANPKIYTLEMVIRTNSGLTKGYGRLTFHEGNHVPAPFRIEFMRSDDIVLYGNPVENSLEQIEKLNDIIENQKELLMEEATNNFSLDEIVTQSPKYKDILAQVAQVADTDTTVLITGETGTGKELLCNSIFRLSDRSDKIIVKVNCGSIPAELMESTLFGHEKGAFTGADKQKIGKFELADGGTIFLDEIGELPIQMQPKLLRVLQEGEIERVGNARPIQVNVRVIAATNRNLEDMVKAGTFRQDLYYRLNIFPIYNIPLRERREDIPLLVQHFMDKLNKKLGKNVLNIKKKDLGFLKRYTFPGNVRELQNIIERGIVMAKSDTIDLSFVREYDENISPEYEVLEFEEAMKAHIIKVLKMVKGKVSGKNSASEVLKINNKTLISRMKKLDIDPKDYYK